MQTSLLRKVISRRTVFRSVSGVLGLATAEAVYEPHTLDVTVHEVWLPNLSRALDGFRVALLTDLHRGTLTPDAAIEDAVAAALRFRPHAVALTGDFIRARVSDIEPCATLLAPLGGVPSIGCLGNHDYNDPEAPGRLVRHLDAHAGVRMLRNASCEVAPGLFFAGIEDTVKGAPDSRTALARVPEDAALVFLTHNPAGVQRVRHLPCVALSGHTHGGQVRVPGFPPHRAPGMEGMPIVAGWGTFGEANLYISRGVGQTGLGLRLNCPPEVALITFRSV